MHLPSVRLQRLSGSKSLPKDCLPLICVAKNEFYFWPFLLAHYRSLGVNHLVILDDQSSDKSLEFLSAQPDVTVLRANMDFGDMYGSLRFGVVIRGLISKKLFPDRWTLIADADEFWITPTGFNSFPDLISNLEEDGHTLCRGVMLDLFPKKLVDINPSQTAITPWRLSPWYDDINPISWPAHSSRPTSIGEDLHVRNRIADRLLSCGHLSRADLIQRGTPAMFKSPLVKWGKNTQLLSAHRVSNQYHNSRQLACAHFKFFPNWQAKVKTAIQSQAYYKKSIEYRVLEMAMEHLQDFDLRGKSSAKLDSFEDLKNFTI